MTGHDNQYWFVVSALAGDEMSVAQMRGRPPKEPPATIDASVIERIERRGIGTRAEVEAMGANIIDPRRPDILLPSLRWRAPWQAVLKAAITWAAGRYGDDSVAAGIAIRICAAHGWALESKRAHRLVRAARSNRQRAA